MSVAIVVKAVPGAETCGWRCWWVTATGKSVIYVRHLKQQSVLSTLVFNVNPEQEKVLESLLHYMNVSFQLYSLVRTADSVSINGIVIAPDNSSSLSESDN